jgi:hypothetical protein
MGPGGSAGPRPVTLSAALLLRPGHGLEDRLELFFKQVGPIERTVGGLDGGQRDALINGEQFGFSTAPRRSPP